MFSSRLDKEFKLFVVQALDLFKSFLARVSSESSFVSKQSKLVSALSETSRLFRLFRFDIETGSFGVSKQPKQTKDPPKQQQIF
jgi:hypothetical protein